MYANKYMCCTSFISTPLTSVETDTCDSSEMEALGPVLSSEPTTEVTDAPVTAGKRRELAAEAEDAVGAAAAVEEIAED